MATVNVFQAKATLSKLIESIESGSEREVVIARHGHPVARLLPVRRQPIARRIGVAKGAFDVAPDARLDARAARLFRSTRPGRIKGALPSIVTRTPAP